MTPGYVIKEGKRLRIRQLREDDLPRMIAGSFGGEQGGSCLADAGCCTGDQRDFVSETTRHYMLLYPVAADNPEISSS